MFLRILVMAFLVVSMKGFGQQELFFQNYKNSGGIVYKTILPVDNSHDLIVKPGHNLGVSYARAIGGNHAVGLNVYYSRSKYFPNMTGIEPFYKYVFNSHSGIISPFVKMNLGFQTALKKDWITFIYTKYYDNGAVSRDTYSFKTNSKVIYANPELGLNIKLGKKYLLEGAAGYSLAVRNFGSKPLDAHLQNIDLSGGPVSYDPWGQPVPQVRPEDINSYYIDLLNLTFSLSFKMLF